MANTRDLSHIKSLKDLQSEILNVKASIVVHETQLKARVKQVPAEAKRMAIGKVVPAALSKVLPFILTKGAVGRSWGLLRNAVGLFTVIKRQKEGGVVNKVFSAVKKAGMSAAIKGVFNIIKKRHHSQEKIEII